MATPLQFVWEDRPFTRWAEHELAKRLLALAISEQSEKMEVSIADVSVSGDCSVCVSMGKKMGLFDLSVNCKWSGQTAEGPKEHGELIIPELVTEDVVNDEYEIKVTGDGQLAVLVREKGIPLVREQVHDFVASLMAAKSGDGALQMEQTRKQNEGVEVVIIEAPKAAAKDSSSNGKVGATAKRTTAGPARNVEVTVHVSDIDKSAIKAERYRFFKEYTLLDTDSVSKAAEQVTSSIVDQGWKSAMFPSVVLVGPMRFDGTPRQIAYMGSVKGFARGTYLPSRRTLGKVLQSLKGNTLRVSPLDPEDALETAQEEAAAELAAYTAKQGERAARREARRKKREERRRKRAETAAAETAAAVTAGDAAPPAAVTAAAEGEGDGSDIYSWGTPTHVMHRPCTIELLDDSAAEKDQEAPISAPSSTSETNIAPVARSDKTVPTLQFE